MSENELKQKLIDAGKILAFEDREI